MASFYLFLIYFLMFRKTSGKNCNQYFCGSQPVRFPFQLKNQTTDCGYLGFDLFCNFNGESILNLPYSGDFIVKSIDYANQTLKINDPNGCITKHFLNSFNLSATPFHPLTTLPLTFLNCSSSNISFDPFVESTTVGCLSNDNYTVVVLRSFDYEFASEMNPNMPCEKISTVTAPVSWSFGSDLSDGVRLIWFEPSCGACEYQGGSCHLVSHTDLTYLCSLPNKHGLSKPASLVLMCIGVPVFILLAIIVRIWQKLGGNKDEGEAPQTVTEPPLPPVSHQEPVVLPRGLDEGRIAAYPKMVIGESGKVAENFESNCPICLCDYKPKETLKIIPDCTHYFHVDCIDAWLRVNASCPVCRNSQTTSFIV
ncbi:putative RING-H2 finger protein ATL21A [Carica papaya]|uniref:putative RING-H2 finger protein ATL21A n=1 Tax=Carica papaya TaxID=3649 RepID=UPI000B8CC3DD|nr:putative RING-H2 finger protein ATL21A [Carica papaya]